MSITRDYIYQSDYTANAQALADWLSANAADYFDSVTASDGTVSCSSGGTVLLEITLTSTSCYSKAITAGGLTDFATSSTSAHRAYYAWKTAHGIAVSISGVNYAQTPSLWITKDTTGNTVIAAWQKFVAPTSSTAGIPLLMASAAAASAYNRGYTLPFSSNRTVLSPLLMSDNDATDLPYLFYTPYSQYSDPGTLTVDGTEYLYSGCIALCDGEPGSGSADLTNYYTRAQTDAKITAVQEGVDANAEEIAAVGAQAQECAVQHNSGAIPRQDGTVEGAYLLVGEYTFPGAATTEESSLTLMIRNTVAAAAQDGILRVRCRYNHTSAAFQYAQIYWLFNSGITAENWVLAYNASEKTVRLYVKCEAAWSGYVCKKLDAGTNAAIDMTMWTLYGTNTGVAELPAEADGWTTVTTEA